MTNFILHTKGAEKEDHSVVVSDPKRTKLPLRMNSTRPEVEDVRYEFQPMQVGLHIIRIKHQGTDISGSPFKVRSTDIESDDFFQKCLLVTTYMHNNVQVVLSKMWKLSFNHFL